MQRPRSSPGAGSFIEDAQSVLRDFRASLAHLLASVSADPGQPQEISRRFGLDKTLAWKVSRFIGEDDAWFAASHIPRRVGLNAFVQALEAHGAPHADAQAVRDVMNEFDAMVERHSGDRDTFDAMLGALSDQVANRRSDAVRKSAFHANGTIFGVRAKVDLHAVFIAPHRDVPHMLDIGAVAGLEGFHRLRREACWPVTRHMIRVGGKTDHPGVKQIALDPSVGPGEMPVMRGFCSSPMPNLRAVPHPGLGTWYEFTEGPVGNTAAETCMLGWKVNAAVPRYATPEDKQGEFFTILSTPAEIGYYDMFIHRDLGFKPPTMRMICDMLGHPAFPQEGRDSGSLPLHEQLIDLGNGLPNVAPPEFPRYSELVETAADGLGWSPVDFHGYRMRMRYPPIPTRLVFTIRLPLR